MSIILFLSFYFFAYRECGREIDVWLIMRLVFGKGMKRHESIQCQF